MKKLWVYLLALAAAVLCLLPAPAHAVGPTSHSGHCICGDTHHADSVDHTPADIIYDWQSLDAVTLNSSTGTTVELDPGYYYLTSGVELNKTLKITGKVTICLSGNNLDCKGSPGIQIEKGATLNITNCNSSGNICQKSIGRHIVNYGTLNLYDVTLWGDNANGGGVQNGDQVNGVDTSGTFTMYGGQIKNCKSETAVGAVQNYAGTFTMYDGHIDDNEMHGVGGVRNSDTMYMYGGSITRNKSTTGTAYGGVWNHGEMHIKGDAQIINNTGDTSEDDQNNLCTANPIYLDGELKNNFGDSAQIELYWMGDFAVGTPVIQAGTATSYTIQDSDLTCFTLVGRNNRSGLSLALYPSANAVKLTNHMDHYLCTGEHDANAPGHPAGCGTNVTFKPWDSADSLPTSGCWYLAEDVTLTDFNSTQINNDIILCLNGHKITAEGDFDTINVSGGGKLTVTDCKNNVGQITHSLTGTNERYTGCGVNVSNGGKFYMYGGQITGNIGDNYTAQCNVYVEGEFYMYGGRISGSAVGVNVYDGTFEMNCAIDGEPAISNSAGGYAVRVNALSDGSGTFCLKNGYIEGGTGADDKYAVEVGRGTTIMLDGTVRIDGCLNISFSAGGTNGKLQVTNSFKLADNSEGIYLKLGAAIGDVSDYFDSTQTWPQDALNKFTGEDGKVFVQTDVANANTDIRLLMPVTVPAAKTGLVYNGTEQTGVEEGTGYTVTHNSATNAGDYTAVVKIKDGYVWQTSSGYAPFDRYVGWSIAQKDPKANDFIVTGLDNYTYDGSAKAVTAALVSNYPTQTDPLTLTVYYTKNGVTTDTAPIDAGTYEVTLEVSGNRNFNAGTVQLGTLNIGSISQSAPTGLTGVAPTTEGGTDGKITGVATSMEYKVENDTSWTSCTGTEITGLSAGTYQVRYRADANHTASDAAVVTVPAYVPSLVTVRFLPNGGSGAMAEVSQYPGAYTLPACGFTAPEGKEFDKWQGIDGAAYAVGDTYNVTGDTELTALWKNKAVTPDPDPVTPDPDPDKPDPDPGKPKPSRPSRPSGSGSSGPVITALPTADGLSPTNYSGGIYGLTFRSSASFSSFRGVKVDGVTLDASCYTAEEGSILVYLKAAYLKTLKEGTHTLTILSTEGDTTMQFTIGAAASARTFDAGVTGYAVTALLSLGGALGLRRRRSSLI